MTAKPKFKKGDTLWAVLPALFKAFGIKPIETKITTPRFSILTSHYYATDTGTWNETCLYATEEEAARGEK